MLTKNPTNSVQGSSVRPAIGPPIAHPPWRRACGAAPPTPPAAPSTGVAPLLRANCVTRAQFAGDATSTLSPPELGAAGRRRSVGNSMHSGNPANSARQYSTCAASTLSGSDSLTQNAPAATTCNRRTAPATAPTPERCPPRGPHTRPRHHGPAAPTIPRPPRCGAAPPPPCAHPTEPEKRCPEGNLAGQIERCRTTAPLPPPTAPLDTRSHPPRATGIGLLRGKDPCRGTPSTSPNTVRKRLVPGHHIPQRRHHRLDVEVAGQPIHRHRNVVRRRRPLEPIQEPQPGLRKRQRHPLRPHPQDQRHPHRRGLGAVSRPTPRPTGIRTPPGSAPRPPSRS